MACLYILNLFLIHFDVQVGSRCLKIVLFSLRVNYLNGLLRDALKVVGRVNCVAGNIRMLYFLKIDKLSSFTFYSDLRVVSSWSAIEETEPSISVILQKTP